MCSTSGLTRLRLPQRPGISISSRRTCRALATMTTSTAESVATFIGACAGPSTASRVQHRDHPGQGNPRLSSRQERRRARRGVPVARNASLQHLPTSARSSRSPTDDGRRDCTVAPASLCPCVNVTRIYTPTRFYRLLVPFAPCTSHTSQQLRLPTTSLTPRGRGVCMSRRVQHAVPGAAPRVRGQLLVHQDVAGGRQRGGAHLDQTGERG